MFLNCKTWFSFHYGTFSTNELVESAAELGVKTLALTNINNTIDCWDFIMKCTENGIKPILGSEIRNENEFLYILLAKNNAGLLAINQFLTNHVQQKNDFPIRPDFQTDEVWIIYRYQQNYPDHLLENELIGIRLQDCNNLNIEKDNFQDKFVILHPVTFQNKTYFNLHRLLRAIHKNTLLSKILPQDTAMPDEILLSESHLVTHFSKFPTILAKTVQVMQSCSVEMDFKIDKNKKYFTSSLQDDQELLRKLAMEGCAMRYGNKNKEAKQRVEKELKMIAKQNFNSYFLIVWDMLSYARERGFFHVGRGSGANSIIAYCLQITDVDPIKLDLYFERFLNPNRSSPPDFDIDFSWQDRDDVFDYLFKRYGRKHVALLGMYSTFQRRAIIRELGKVFGLPKQEIDSLVANNLNESEDKIQQLIYKYGTLLKDFPNHLSIHAGGVLISEQPLNQYGAMEMPPKGFQTMQMDMFEADRIGLFKFDILSQRGLGHIKDAILLIKQSQGKDIDIHQVDRFFEDPLLKEKIKNADTIGCFYIESPAMRQLLGKLKCSDYITLVAASSIIRPGVAQSGMMKQYIERYHDPSKTVYLHPKMEELLKETYGVMVYQEDVIKVAHHFGGISLDDADILRRAMSGKYRSENKFEKLRNLFFKNCREIGYEEKVIAEVWRQMESFGGYSFAKGHSASFAVESYQSLFLQTYYPREFYVAVINNFGGFYKTEFYFHELKKNGADIELPCLNHSDYLTNIQHRKVYVGFIHLQGLEEKLAKEIADERKENGPFKGLTDVMLRLKPAPEQLNILIRIGALRFTGIDKKTLLWQANFKSKHKEKEALALFAQEDVNFELPEFETNRLEDLRDELDLLGFLIHDFYELLDEKHLIGTVSAKEFPVHLGKEIKIIGRLVTTKNTYTIKNDIMCFGTFLDQHGDWLDTVHFPPSMKKYPFLGYGFYELRGVVMQEFDVYSMEVRFMRKLGYRFGR